LVALRPGDRLGPSFRRRALIALAIWLALAVSWTAALAVPLHVPNRDPSRVAAQVFALGALVVAFVMARGESGATPG